MPHHASRQALPDYPALPLPDAAAMPPPHGEDDSSALKPLIPMDPTPPPPRRATARLHLLPLLVGVLFATYYHLLVAPAASYYQSLFLSLGSNDTAAAHLRALTVRPHLAGTEANALAADHVASTLSSLSFPTRVTPYDVLLSYPVSRSLSLSAPGRNATAFALVQEGCERVSVAEAMATDDMPGIPALPVSGRDGEAILRLIGGDVAPEDWQGSDGDGAPVYHLGPGPAVLNLTYTGNETIATIQNVISVIEGNEEPDRYVILGNHRDAWTFGAADPNSGTAALLELAQRLSKLQNKGWRPRRTIILCNWDAEEYGLIGSTEWVEENRAMLTSRTVAYLNVDVGVSGSGVDASATPQLDELLKQASKKVQNPDNGSDYSAFVQHIGIPSVDMAIGTGYAVYHSLYDDFTWMEKYGDPMFRRHVAVASVWGLVALRLSDEEILPFNYSSYAAELENGAVDISKRVLGMPVSLSPLHKSIKQFNTAVLKVDSELQALQTSKFWSLRRNNPLRMRDLNDRLMMTERAFTEREGLSGRPWYKHMIYGPSLYNDYGAEVYPGVDDAIQTAKKTNTSQSWQSVQHEIHRIARVISQAALVLSGGLT